MMSTTDRSGKTGMGEIRDNMDLAVGTIVTGKVTSITKFGAFVALPGGKSGLVHISEVASAFVSDVHDFLSEGQEISVKILSVSPEGRINLSVRQAAGTPSQPNRPARRPVQTSQAASSPADTAEPSFEEKLKKFMSQSASVQSDFNRHMAVKRGGKRKK